MRRAWEQEKRGNGAKGRSDEVPAALTSPEISLLMLKSALFRKLFFFVAFIRIWRHHIFCVCVAACCNTTSKGTRFCQVLQTFCMKDILL